MREVTRTLIVVNNMRHAEHIAGGILRTNVHPKEPRVIFWCPQMRLDVLRGAKFDLIIWAIHWSRLSPREVEAASELRSWCNGLWEKATFLDLR